MDFSLNFAQICSLFIPVDRVAVVSRAIVIVSLLLLQRKWEFKMHYRVNKRVLS